MAFTSGEFYTDIQKWCHGWWHKVKYGSKREVTFKCESGEVVEYFCNKCGDKTDGFTHFGPVNIIVSN